MVLQPRNRIRKPQQQWQSRVLRPNRVPSPAASPVPARWVVPRGKMLPKFQNGIFGETGIRRELRGRGPGHHVRPVPQNFQKGPYLRTWMPLRRTEAGAFGGIWKSGARGGLRAHRHVPTTTSGSSRPAGRHQRHHGPVHAADAAAAAELHGQRRGPHPEDPIAKFVATTSRRSSSTSRRYRTAECGLPNACICQWFDDVSIRRSTCTPSDDPELRHRNAADDESCTGINFMAAYHVSSGKSGHSAGRRRGGAIFSSEARFRATTVRNGEFQSLAWIRLKFSARKSALRGCL